MSVLPKYDPKKVDLPRRENYIGSLSWLRAVRDCIGEDVVFALDQALMCQGSFGGRTLGSFDGFLNKPDELRHAYNKFRFGGDVSKPAFEDVYETVRGYIAEVLSE